MKISTCRHIILGIGSFLVLFLGLSVKAAWTDNVIPTNTMNNPGSGCYFTDLYLSDDNNGDGTGDFGLYLNTNLLASGRADYGFEAWKILQSGSRVSYYAPLSNMIYKSNSGVIGPIDNSTFYRASFVLPYNIPVRAIATVPNLIVFQAPSDNDPNKNIVSLQYNYQYVYATNIDESKTYDYWYNQVPDLNYYGNSGLNFVTTLPGKYGNKLRTWSTPQSLTTCRNYQIHRCGDGKIDSDVGYTGADGIFTGVNYFLTGFFAEGCDDGPANGEDSTIAFCTPRCSPPPVEFFPEVFL